ncbi:DegT/DnrJ/EryC1/StrS family aminotransferase [Paraglaciecola arctica]|uniref:Aminotransferase, DegT/DnrJ/EryC1/StrS family protein n=1 Tax=Paraglaciecola arctica BSs20135 TaxID=493475 RepID=K6Y7K4_9ALTE|nr:DegT/DnrJ/EryC1/StrS family aminotransferase [Paraglaciecola arctica]GAC19916.1 aminotransferase, DegT/DnrJ/EryC1/StrS family protein [Paraglaciecola arctica BSs20135]
MNTLLKINTAYVETISTPLAFQSPYKKNANFPIPLNKPYLPSFSKYTKYLATMYDNVWLTNNGPLLKELTVRMEEYLGVKNLLLTSSGTMALQIAYKTLNLTGNVITTPYSFIATSNSLDWLGLELNFADIDNKTFNLCPIKALEAINNQTSAIVPVHVYGNPCNLQALENIATQHNLKLIYDAAHAFNVKVAGRSVMSFGDASIVSFHATKLFHCIEGGAVVFKHKDDFEKAENMINFGINLSSGEINNSGTNGKMSEAHAAMGLAMLDDIDEILERRIEHFNLYKALLGDRIAYPQWHQDATQNAAYFPVIFESKNQCTRAFQHLEKAGIQSRRYFFPSLNKIEHLSTAKQTYCPVSESLANRTLCLPLFVELSYIDIKKICIALINSLRGANKRK